MQCTSQSAHQPSTRHPVLGLANRYGLSVCDAPTTYLELALRLGLLLARLDRALAETAKADTVDTPSAL